MLFGSVDIPHRPPQKCNHRMLRHRTRLVYSIYPDPDHTHQSTVYRRHNPLAGDHAQKMHSDPKQRRVYRLRRCPLPSSVDHEAPSPANVYIFAYPR